MRDKHNFSVCFMIIGKHYILGVVNGKFGDGEIGIFLCESELVILLKCETKTETPFI